MSLFSIFDIAGTGMSAQSVRMNVTTSNLANAESASSSVEKTYRARHPVFGVLMNNLDMSRDKDVAGVRVLGVVESQAPLRMQYAPDHPLADEQGNIHLPNVNVVEEMANMISASRSYQNNIEAITTAKQLLQRTLSLGQ
jgi:flagellar basal-body rod protein FlgC